MFLLTSFLPALIVSTIGAVFVFVNTDISRKTRFITFLILIVIYTTIHWYLFSSAINHGLTSDIVSYVFNCILLWFIDILITVIIQLFVIVRE